jgi:uncharacterized OB-fold protein
MAADARDLSYLPTETHVTRGVPIVNYLMLDDGAPHLVAQECTSCGARYLANRLACARCGKREFSPRTLPTTGEVGSFTIIHRAAPGVPTPYVSALVDLDDGTTVKSNVVGCPADDNAVRLHMRVRLTTFIAGTDDDGTTAIAFGFEPDEAASTRQLTEK